MKRLSLQTHHSFFQNLDTCWDSGCFVFYSPPLFYKHWLKQNTVRRELQPSVHLPLVTQPEASKANLVGEIINHIHIISFKFLKRIVHPKMKMKTSFTHLRVNALCPSFFFGSQKKRFFFSFFLFMSCSNLSIMAVKSDQHQAFFFLFFLNTKYLRTTRVAYSKCSGGIP